MNYIKSVGNLKTAFPESPKYEHAECELKKTWSRDSQCHRAVFVKDIQATANSAIAPDQEKFIVLGADQETRTITGCSPSDFDDAGIRQLLERRGG